MSRLAPFFHLVSQSKLSILGAALVTSAILGDLILILGELFFFETNPYIGIVVYAVFPGLAMAGLGLIPLGAAWKARRRGAANLEQGIRVLGARNIRGVLQVVLILTMANLVIFAAIGYRSYHFMESREFCGKLCHQPMHAEYGAYLESPHSEVDCVECHIGSGVSWLIKSKLDGTRQLVAMVTDNYSRPIQTPLHNLRPARDVCEVCHQPESFHGNLIKVIQTFEPDEQNTRNYTILNLRVGGGESQQRKDRGIHWHVSKNRSIRYLATDRRRENIVLVEQVDAGGEVLHTWTRPDAELGPIDARGEELRTMDCIDCHNRPTHIYLPPEKALDQLLRNGEIDPKLPWIRKLGMQVITRVYASEDEGLAGIAELAQLYEAEFPEVWQRDRAAIEAAIPALQEIWTRYVHPEMGIEWNTYPSLIGHPTAATAACFRCHDGVLEDEAGRKITADCEACHFVLADKERDPMILRILEDR